MVLTLPHVPIMQVFSLQGVLFQQTHMACSALQALTDAKSLDILYERAAVLTPFLLPAVFSVDHIIVQLA